VTITTPSLVLPAAWADEPCILVRATDAIRMCRDGGFEKASPAEANALVGGLDHRRAGSVRAFVAQSRLACAPLVSIRDEQLLALLRAWVKNQELVVLRPSGMVAGGEGKALLEQRKLVREIESQVRGGLVADGRHYKLVAGEDLRKLPDRDRYEVARQADALRVLDTVAKQLGDGGGQGVSSLVARVRDQLTRDWRPPALPDGLVLLRRIAVLAAQKQVEAPAFSPSALKKLRDEGWIEIVFVDAGMEPIADADFDLRLSDGQVKTGKTNEEGTSRQEGITPGECQVRFPKAKGPVALV